MTTPLQSTTPGNRDGHGSPGIPPGSLSGVGRGRGPFLRRGICVFVGSEGGARRGGVILGLLGRPPAWTTPFTQEQNPLYSSSPETRVPSRRTRPLHPSGPRPAPKGPAEGRSEGSPPGLCPKERRRGGPGRAKTGDASPLLRRPRGVVHSSRTGRTPVPRPDAGLYSQRGRRRRTRRSRR